MLELMEEPYVLFWQSNLALLYAGNNTNLAEALKLAEQSAMLRPCWDSYYSFGYVNYKMKNYKKAVEFFEKSVRLNSNDIKVWSFLEEIHTILGNKEKAKECRANMLRINPNYTKNLFL